MPTKTVQERATSDIAAALLLVVRTMSQVKVHEAMCRQAGVELDRGGAALLYKLFSEGEHVRITELAERLAIDPPAVTRKVQQLQRNGLVCRQVDDCDARASRVGLTGEGRQAIEKLLAVREQRIADPLSGWTSTDRR